MRTDYKEAREWIVDKLNWLELMCDNPDLGLNIERLNFERNEIRRHRERIEHGKYRVVFLGAFNVGKSTLINAIIGGEYLPAKLEECTAKVIHLINSSIPQITVKIDQTVSKKEARKLFSVFGQNGSTYESSEYFKHVFDSECKPSDIKNMLERLVTVAASEDNGRGMCKLINGISEIEIFINLPEWANDIVLTDSPGVNSMSDTREEIAFDIIPKSNLVIMVIDSESAGNRGDLDFIRRIVENRRRHILFVINKSDQLEADEIDELCNRGPSRGLKQSLAGIVDSPEIYFVSSLYALRGRQLSSKDIKLPDVINSNKIKLLPSHYISCQHNDLENEAASREIGEYLVSSSRIFRFEQRIDEYLHNEDKSFAVVQEGLYKLCTLCEEFMVCLSRQLDSAQNPELIEVLKRDRDSLGDRLEDIKSTTDNIFNSFNTRINGGVIGDVEYPNLLVLPRELFSYAKIESEIVEPFSRWLNDPLNYEITIDEKTRSRAISHYIGLVDDFQSRAICIIEREFKRPTLELNNSVRKVVEEFQGLDNITFNKLYTIPPSDINIGWEKFYYIIASLFTLGVAAIFSSSPSTVRKNKIIEHLRGHSRRLFVDGFDIGNARKDSVKDVFEQKLLSDWRSIQISCRNQIKNKCNNLMSEIDDIIKREGEIKASQEELIYRLQPYVDVLCDTIDTSKTFYKKKFA